jgi:putative FmdB family regulatory protein
MPLYEYRCSGCGPFDVRGEAAVAAAGASCPSCGAPAARIFSAPGGRAPRGQRQLKNLSRSALSRIDRAQTGAPGFGGMAAGMPIDRGGKPLVRRTGTDHRRPWQLGH